MNSEPKQTSKLKSFGKKINGNLHVLRFTIQYINVPLNRFVMEISLSYFPSVSVNVSWKGPAFGFCILNIINVDSDHCGFAFKLQGQLKILGWPYLGDWQLLTHRLCWFLGQHLFRQKSLMIVFIFSQMLKQYLSLNWHC